MTVEERRRLRAASKAATKAARGTDELPLCAVLEDLARYPVSTWGQIARSDDHEALVRLAFELGAGWRRLPPGRWEFDVQRADSPEGADHATILRARLAERDLSVLSSPEGSSREASCPEASPVMAPPAHEAPHPRSAVG
jgi:hypothetical protein